MRVLHVLHNSLPLVCGYSVRSAAIIEHQRRLGLDPVVVTSAQNPNPGAALADVVDGVVHYRTAPFTGSNIPLLRERAMMRALQSRIEAVIAEVRPDVVHAHSPVLVGLPALRAARDHGLPFVYEIRDLWENASVDRGKFAHNSLRYRLARRIETHVLRQADAVVTICETLRGELADRVGGRSRVTVVANGVDPSSFDPATSGDRARARWNLGGARVIAYVGTFQPYEGLDLLVRAMAMLAARCPDARLVIAGGSVGQSTALEVSLRHLARDLGVSDRIVFTGRVPHQIVNELYAAADVLAYPRILTRTTALTTPLKPLEAMAMGKAVVASDVPAMQELVADDQTGLICRAGDAEDLARCCLTLLENRELAAALGARAHRWILDTRRWPLLVDRYQQIYRTVLASTSFPAAAASEPAAVGVPLSIGE
jgi:PEP-CTERM/exosortase A-associated glycosyltransferase